MYGWCVPCRPSSSHHTALMAAVPSDEQGREENLISPPAVYHAGYHWLCRDSPVREWAHDLIQQLWP